MISGQILDLEAEGKVVDVEGIRRIHALKTGRLFVSSVRIGALLAGAAPGEMLVLTGFAEKLGQVFQIVDDILDVIGTTEELGKTAGIDAINEKATYPRAVGLEKAWADARALGAQALEALAGLGRPTGMLPGFVGLFLDRRT
jgi:geranylgeranyl pyrophosphate synthase